MKHQHWENLLVDYEDGALDEKTCAMVDEHLQKCGDCQALLSFSTERGALERWYQGIPTAFAEATTVARIAEQRDRRFQRMGVQLASWMKPARRATTWPRPFALPAASVLVVIVLVLIFVNQDRSLPLGPVVANAYEQLQSLQTLRYTKTTSREDCMPPMPPESLHPNKRLPWSQCSVQELEALGEVVSPGSWHEKTLRRSGNTSRTYMEFLAIGGVTYVNTGSAWLRKNDINLQFPLSWLFPADTLNQLERGVISVEVLPDEDIGGAVTNHYRIRQQLFYEAVVIEVWVDKEDRLPRKIHQRSERLKNAPLPPEPPFTSVDGFPVVVSTNKWRDETYVFYDFNAPIVLEPPALLAEEQQSGPSFPPGPSRIMPSG